MAGEDHTHGSVSVSLPPEVDDWLADAAEERGETREEICRRLVTAAQTVTTDAGETPVDPETRLEDIEAQFEGVEAQLEDQRAEFVDLLEDVRSRVIQVKRDADANAPADHDHPEHASTTETEALREGLAELEEHLEGGFDNFETILEDVLARLDDVEERSTILARAVLDLREHHDTVLERERRRAALEQLRLTANRVGVRTAACDACGASVDIALLTAPACPDCASPISDVVENTAFFGSHTLVTGDPPSLEGREDDLETSTDAVFEAVESDAADDTALGTTATDSNESTSFTEDPS